MDASIVVVMATACSANFATLPITGMQRMGPNQAIERVIRHYQSLRHLDVTILHHDDSGLFPGDYTQTLRWSAGNAFELKVTNPSRGAQVPDYASDGQTVKISGGNASGNPRSEKLNTDPNLEPGYEVSGGPVLSWLLHSPTGAMFLSPAVGMEFSYSWGPAKTWRGMKVREVDARLTAKGITPEEIRIYLGADSDTFVGWEAPIKSVAKGSFLGKDGYLVYENQAGE